jgi:hypothetical protein
MRMVKGAWSAPAEILYYLFEDPMWFKQMGLKGAPLLLAGEIIVWSVNFLIGVSTIAFCVESMRQFSSDPEVCPYQDEECDPDFWADVWFYVEVLCVSVFTLDFIVRAGCCYILGTLTAFSENWYNWIDVMAIAPFFLTGIWPNMADFRFLRVIRLTRILKSLGDKMEATGNLIFMIVTKAAPALGLPIFLMMLSCMCLAGLTFYAEQTQSVMCVLDSGEIIEPWIGWKGQPGTEDCSFSDPVVSTDTSGTAYPHGSALSLVEVSTFSMTKADATPKVYNSSTRDFGTYRHVTLWGPWAWHDYEMKTVGDAEGYVDIDGDGDLDLVNVGCACPGTIVYRTFDGIERSSEVFPDVFTATWWTLVTYTTVGYGDINPVTFTGQTLAAFTMFVGVFFLAMPLAIVGGTFTDEYNNVQNRLEKMRGDKAMNDEERVAWQESEKAKEQARDDVMHRLKEYGPVTAHASVKAHFHRVRILANTLYQVVPDDAPDIKEEMGRFLLKLKAADWNAKQINLVHDTEEDAVLEEVSAKREKKGRFGRKAKKEDESGNESPGKKSPRAVKAK